MKRTILIILVVAALAVAGYFGLQALRSNQAAAAATQYQTVAVSRGELTASVGGTGTVRANQTAVLSWQTSGNIEKLNVGVGDTVGADQVLATLKESSLSQSIILARADLVTARRNLENLTSSDVARATAYQTLVAAEKELTDAKTRRLSKQYTRGSQSTIEINQADLLLAQDNYNQAVDNYNLFAERTDVDLMKANALSRLAAARQALERAKANLQYVQTMPNDNEVAQADARLQVAEARLKDAQREWDRIKDGPAGDDITAAEARIKAIETTLAMVDLNAPFAGTITEVRGKTGDQVAPGTVTYRLDDLSRLLVDVQITEVDINRIQVNQPVTLSFDAIQDKEYQGIVAEVGRVGTAVQGLVNFTVTIELKNPDDKVRPGMTAAVTITTDQLPDVLLVPNRAVRLRASKYVVYVLKDGIPTVTNISLGLTSDEFSQVIDGLKEGDVLVLNPPTELQSGPPAAGGGLRGGN
jgi:HlyD family secretion protein